MKKLKQYDIPVEVFEFGFTLILGDRDAATEFVKKHLDDDAVPVQDQDMGRVWYKENSGLGPVMWLPCYPKTPRDFGFLAHEASHIVMYMLDEKCIPIRREDEEVFAYNVGYIVKKVLEVKK